MGWQSHEGSLPAWKEDLLVVRQSAELVIKSTKTKNKPGH
jgi:hypothetical protein